MDGFLCFQIQGDPECLLFFFLYSAILHKKTVGKTYHNPI